ncbi:MAG: hypothetical protein AAF800_00665 [Planctomycetota bacterium]
MKLPQTTTVPISEITARLRQVRATASIDGTQRATPACHRAMLRLSRHLGSGDEAVRLATAVATGMQEYNRPVDSGAGMLFGADELESVILDLAARSRRLGHDSEELAVWSGKRIAVLMRLAELREQRRG